MGTVNMDTTPAFYKGVLGFKAVRRNIVKVKEGGSTEAAARRTRSSVSYSAWSAWIIHESDLSLDTEPEKMGSNCP